MEIYFRVKGDNPIYKKYFEWWNNLDVIKKKWEQFRKLVGIESTQFVPKKELYIVPTENDLIKFGRFFYKQDYGNGLRKFKATSTIQKDWERFCNNNVKFIDEPILFYDFPIMGKSRTRLFHYNDDVYGSISSDYIEDDFKIPDGYEQIKASEFYKIIETIEEED